MARTTPEQVASIIEVDPSIPVGPFIETASTLVEEVCEPFNYTENRLELIERWLAAHFYAIMDKQVASERAGSVGQDFQFKVDLGLNQTQYGQQAMILDTKGGLRALNDRGSVAEVKVHWLGKLPKYRLGEC